MKPSLSQMMTGAATSLLREVIPNVGGDAYAISSAGTVGTLLMLMAQEADRTVDTLVIEMDAIQALFADAAELPLPAELKGQLAAAARLPRPSLKVSALEEQASGLKSLLIVLHETVEASKFDWAAQLESRIWEILTLGAQCRVVYLPTL